MAIELNDAEARVLGVLVEKALTTPDNYPLSLNALVNGCNQKSNRDPVTDLVEAEVVVALQGLTPKGLAGRVVQAGSRVEKFRHTANATLDVDDACLAVLAELLMRGPQSQGELRARVNRMAPTPTLPELQDRLQLLIARGFVERVAPAPGSRAERFAQRLAPGLHPVRAAASGSPAPAPTATIAATTARGGTGGETGLAERVERLENRLDRLAETVETLLARLGD